jgi:hypothetical protein
MNNPNNLIVKTNCSNWGQGWGFGGSDHLGKLSFDGQNFVYTGIRQGRHNRIIRGKKIVKFSLQDWENKGFDGSNFLPDFKTVQKSIDFLINELLKENERFDLKLSKAKYKDHQSELKKNQMKLF